MAFQVGADEFVGLGMQNDASKNEANKEILKMKKQIEYWKEQAGLSPEQRAMVDMSEVQDQREPKD